MSKKREYRNISFTAQEDSRTVFGFIPYMSRSEYLGWYELLAPGCFTRTLRDSKDIQALYEHDPARLLARTKNESLRFEDRDDGLHFEIDLPDTTEGNDALQMVRSGLIDSCSFGFRCIKDRLTIENGQEVRTVIEAQLYEVSLVSQPAYPETEVYMRSLSEAFKDKEQLSDEEITSVREEIDKLSALLPKDPEPAPEETNQPEPEQPATEPETIDPEPDEKQLEAVMQRLEAAQEKLRSLTNDDSRT